MAFKTSPIPQSATAGRKMQRMYTKQFGHKCEDCGDDALGRRTRCKRCGLLVCGWCYNHVHNLPMNGFKPNACGATA